MLQRYIGRTVIPILVLLIFVINQTRSASPRRYDRHAEIDKISAVQNVDDIGQFGPYARHHPGRHVCTKFDNKAVKTKHAYCKPIFKQYTVRCQGNQICQGVRLVYETHYKDVPHTRSINDMSYWCCPGWTQSSNRSYGCNKAFCSKPCLNGGRCVKPEMCACLKGFSGPQCEIVVNIPECDQPCQNNGYCIGRDTCKCPKGFSGKYCEKDIDECKEQKPCDQICYNTPGSFYCQCKEDFVLQDDGQSCRSENDGVGIEAKDLEFEMLDQRLHKLETMMTKSTKSDVSKDDFENLHNDMIHISKDISNLKIKINDVESYKNDVHILKNKLFSIEKKAEKVDDLLMKYDRMKKCAMHNKICI